MEKNDTYLGFAERYDYMIPDNKQRKQFFRSVFDSYKIKTVLDCACGTGKDLIFFKTLNLEVQGSDLSKSMLTQAQKNFDSSGFNINTHQLDFRQLHHQFSTQFDAVVCLSNSINELHNDSEVVDAIGSMRSVLKKNGIIILDQGQTQSSIKRTPNVVPIFNDRNLSRLFVLKYTEELMIVDICDFIHTEHINDFKRNTFHVKLRFMDDWRQIIEPMGFAETRFIGDWDGNPYDDESSNRLIILLKVD